MSKKNKLDALISLYNIILKDILYFQNKGDSPNVINVVPIAIIPLLEIFNVSSFVTSIICLFTPVLQCMSLQRGLQAHTFVAMLRGYAANIEDSINNIIGKRQFIYNSVMIDEYIASDKIVESKGLKTSWFAMAVMHYAILGICVLFFIYLNKNQKWWIFVLAALWFSFMTIVITKLCIKFSKKESKRFKARELARNMGQSDAE